MKEDTIWEVKVDGDHTIVLTENNCDALLI